MLDLTYVPFLAAACEIKDGTVTQHSVKELQSLGVQPDVLVRNRAQLKHVFGVRKWHYSVMWPKKLLCNPLMLLPYMKFPCWCKSKASQPQFLRKWDCQPAKANLEPWKEFLKRRSQATDEVKIALVGKYVELQDATNPFGITLAGSYLQWL